MVRFLFNIYFFKDALVYKFKYHWCAWFFHILYHTQSSISAIFRTHPTLVSLSPVLSTPQWETSISSCLPRSQYISLFSVFIANITGLFNLINFLNSKKLFKSSFYIGCFSSQCYYCEIIRVRGGSIYVEFVGTMN